MSASSSSPWTAIRSSSGIEAPRTIPVHRSEVYEEIQRTNRAAAGEDAPPPPAKEKDKARVADLGKTRRPLKS